MRVDPPPAGEPRPRPRARDAWERARAQISIILTLGTCVIALIWLIMLVVIDTERRTAIEHARNEANNLSAAFHEEISQTLKSVARAMEAVAGRMRARNGGFDIHAWAQEYPFLIPATILGTIVGPDGKVLSTTLEAGPKPVDVSDREHFRVHLNGDFPGVFISKPVVGRISGQTTIQMSRRVTAADGSFLGVVVFSLLPGQLTTLHRSIDLGQRGELVVAGTSDHVVRARFGPGNENGGVEIAAWPPPGVSAGEDSGTVRTFIRESMPDQVRRLHSVRPIEGYHLLVAVALDMNEIVRPAARRARLIMAIGIIATLMLGGLIALLIVEIRRRTDREVKLRDEQARLAAEIQQGREVQERLRASESRLRDFAEMASDWFWELDAELRFIETRVENPVQSGRRRSYIGKHPWEAFDTSQAPEAWARHKRDLLAHRPFREFRDIRRLADGKVVHVSINGNPVFDAAGAFLGYRGTGRDITAKVEAEAELRRSRDQAEASNMAKSAFLANMSYELRTPLNAIIGFAELIHSRKSGRVTADSLSWAGDILSSGRHLLDLINDVLELSRIEAGRYDLNDDTVDLGRVVRGCLAMVRRQAEKNRVCIDYRIEENQAVLRADRRALKQIVLNLLTNAVKFTPGGGTVSIRVATGAGGALALVVTDTGIGIDAEVLPLLCKPFIQADASTSRRYGGTGLGLAISSKLVTMHGGTLTIESSPGKGTTVWVNFPAARVVASTPRTAEVVV